MLGLLALLQFSAHLNNHFIDDRRSYFLIFLFTKLETLFLFLALNFLWLLWSIEINFPQYSYCFLVFIDFHFLFSNL